MRPTLEEIKQLNNSYNIIPVCKEILSDIKTPINVLKNLKAISKKHYLLESVSNEKWSRFSFLGFDPIEEIKCKDNNVTIISNEIKTFYSNEPMNEIRKIISKYKSPHFDYLPNFTGGFVGYASYDTIRYAEPVLKFNSKDIAKFDDYHFMLFDKVIAFDNLKQKIMIIVNIKNDNNVEANYKEAEKEIDKLISIIKNDYDLDIPQNKIYEPIKAHDTFDSYSKKLEKIKKHIIDGDIFQCVFSRRFQGKMKGDLFNTYRVLRTLNPSPYMLFMETGDLQIAGASPETLVKKENDLLQTFPIAGTRPRGKNEKEDLALEADLMADEKELAEHNMLVDLGRNDIGKISKFGSVEVVNYQYIMRFSHVMHITSTVNGQIKDDKDAIDALQSILPAGTLSGAPKIRACQIIDSLEDERRGIYGGAMGYIDFRGNLDMCICIRTAIKKGDDVYVQAGGGIVLDSKPEMEYQETENKAKAMLKAIELSQGEII